MRSSLSRCSKRVNQANDGALIFLREFGDLLKLLPESAQRNLSTTLRHLHPFN